MAEVRGPLLSISASGSVADAVTFRRARGQNLARAFASPRDVPSAAQLVQRGYVAASGPVWRVLTKFGNAADQAAWALRGVIDGPMSGWNAFSRYYLDARRANHPNAHAFLGFTVLDAHHGSFRVQLFDPTGGTSLVDWHVGPSRLQQPIVLTRAEAANVAAMTAVVLPVAANTWVYVWAFNQSTFSKSGLYRLKAT